jgi:phospholipid/cholesterol/gamma-HCH transport system substrate-binding protein
MHLNRQNKFQLAIFVVIALVFGTIMIFGYMKLPAKLFGIGRYTVTMELPRAGGLYPTGNVTYRGTEVGRVDSVGLTDTGAVAAVLSLRSGINIPSNLRAEVHSQSAIGEQYVELLPRDAASPPLKNGDLIPEADTSVPPDINSLLDAATTGLQAIPRENLKTAIDESYLAVGGLGPEISRLVKGSTTLAIDARKNLEPLTTLIDRWQPVVNSQTDTSDSIQAWAAHLATVTTQLQTHDKALAGLITEGAPAAAEAQQLFQRLQPTLPILLANLVSVGEVAVTYQSSIEQLLVLLPAGVANLQGGALSNLNTDQDYKGAFLSFNTNINLPPTCSTGFLPAQQRRAASFEDDPDRPAGDLYCRIPQDAAFNVRGARNLPCTTVPGKRAPTAKMCESDEYYVPLNEGYNWKGDPNATLSGQDVPQLPPSAPAAPPVAVAEYDPATGDYVGPDGQMHTQADLADTAPTEKTWESMLIPPQSNP